MARPERPVVGLLVALWLAPVPASAWGSDGHRAIGEIAWHLLSPEAELEVERLLEPGPYGTLAAAGYWADSFARWYRAFDGYTHLHYVNVDPSADAYDEQRDCPEGCVLSAIEELAGRLADPERPLWERAQDFRFLVHFVEDLHQPLHVVHPDGRGGNHTRVTFLDEETNVHSLWDYGIIRRRLREIPEIRRGRETIEPWRRWAWELRRSIADEDRVVWEAETDPTAWAAEGIVLARRHIVDVAAGETLGEAYYETSIPVVERRVQAAAVRLAALLNGLFGAE